MHYGSDSGALGCGANPLSATAHVIARMQQAEDENGGRVPKPIRSRILRFLFFGKK